MEVEAERPSRAPEGAGRNALDQERFGATKTTSYVVNPVMEGC